MNRQANAIQEKFRNRKVHPRQTEGWSSLYGGVDTRFVWELSKKKWLLR